MKNINRFIILVLLMLVSIPTTNAFGWGFRKNDQHLVPDVGFYQSEIHGTNSYYVGNKQKTVYLTFDCGYDNGNIEKIIKILNDNNVQSTFFCTGDFLERNEHIVNMIVDNGHYIGNHTYSHKEINCIDRSTLIDEITKVEAIYKDITGNEMIKLFRPPKGSFDKKSLDYVKELGYNTFFWSIAYCDWDVNNQKGYDYTFNSVIDNLHDGAIILMHSVSDDNVKALPDIISKTKSLGYSFDSLTNINDEYA